MFKDYCFLTCLFWLNSFKKYLLLVVLLSFFISVYFYFKVWCTILNWHNGKKMVSPGLILRILYKYYFSGLACLYLPHYAVKTFEIKVRLLSVIAYFTERLEHTIYSKIPKLPFSWKGNTRKEWLPVVNA